VNPVTKVLNGGGMMSDAAAIFWGRLIIAVLPLLIVSTGMLAIWVVEIRSTIYTDRDHISHMELHNKDTGTVSPQILRELERVNQRLIVIEDHILKSQNE
jgi:hypothetical protein